MQCTHEYKRITDMTAWWDFVQYYEKQLLNDIKSRKERFKIIAFEWQNHKADLVSVNVYYVKQLQDTINALRSKVQQLECENQTLIATLELTLAELNK